MSISEVRHLEEAYRAFEGKGDVLNLFPAISAFKDWHSAALVLFSDYISEIDSDYIDFKDLAYGNNGYTMHSAFTQIAGKYNLLMHKVERMISRTDVRILDNQISEDKQPMIFISHASADKAFVDALVRLLEGIGFDETNLFCSSIPEYGIALGESIYDKLLNLFRDKKLYVLFVHSPRYYTRPVCLNEMGAAWVLKTEYYSILTKDMSYEMMTGVVTSERIGIKVDAADASARLNELYESLKSAFSLSALLQTKWERLRNTFLSDVNTIQSPLLGREDLSNGLSEEYVRLSVNRMKREEEDLKRAQICGNIVHGDKGGSRELRIFNAGKAKATNVVVEWLNDDDKVFVRGDFNIGELMPQNKRTYYVLLCCGCPDVMHLRYRWSDELNLENVYEEQLQLS